ncbi:MAG: BON domain-containing protein [Terriglobia bacterium]|jgi:hyperosmotically inducible protein
MRANLKIALASVLVLLGLVVVSPLSVMGAAGQIPAQSEANVQRQVLHQLRMLPYYTVFDDLNFKVDGYTVELSGQVTNPALKSDAEGVVKHIEGVQRVINNIEVLPLSGFDNRIRLAEYRAIYSSPGFERYFSALPPIHIIVKNGHVKLIGVVADQFDRNVAGIRANGVSGVFSVENDLRVES